LAILFLDSLDKKIRQATKRVDLAKILAKASWPTFMAFGPRQNFDTLSH